MKPPDLTSWQQASSPAKAPQKGFGHSCCGHDCGKSLGLSEDRVIGSLSLPPHRHRISVWCSTFFLGDWMQGYMTNSQNESLQSSESEQNIRTCKGRVHRVCSLKKQFHLQIQDAHQPKPLPDLDVSWQAVPMGCWFPRWWPAQHKRSVSQAQKGKTHKSKLFWCSIYSIYIYILYTAADVWLHGYTYAEYSSMYAHCLWLGVWPSQERKLYHHWFHQVSWSWLKLLHVNLLLHMYAHTMSVFRQVTWILWQIYL